AAENAKVAKARKEAEKAGVKTARIEAAQEKVRKAELALERARAKRSKTSRDNSRLMAEADAEVSKALAAKERAQEAYDRAVDRAKDKSAKLKEATDELRQAQEQLADAARSSSDAFAGLYTDPSGGFRGLISNMKTGATEITAFTKQVEKLRKLGLNEGTIQQVLGIAQSEGVQAAGQFANELLGRGKGGIRQLNDAAKKLSD